MKRKKSPSANRSPFIRWIIAMMLLWWLLLVRTASSALQTIKLASIFHKGEEELERAFDQALADLAEEQTSVFRFEGVKLTNVEVDGFKAMKLICKLLADEPIAAIFGPRPPETRTVAASIAGKFGIPHFEYTFRSKDELVASGHSINVYPGNGGYERAIAETARVMSWQSYTFVFQSYGALARIQEALENRGRPRNYPINMRELMRPDRMRQLKTKHEVDMIYEGLVKSIHKLNLNSVLLDVESDNLPKLLRTMNVMGLMGDYFMCLIANIDSSSVDVRDFVSGDSVANVTQFKFPKGSWLTNGDGSRSNDDDNDNNNHDNDDDDDDDDNDNDDDNGGGGGGGMSVAAALLYDAVFAFADALISLQREASYQTDEGKPTLRFESRPRACYPKDYAAEAYELGPNITAAVLRKTKYGRKTGLMSFVPRSDEPGLYERLFELDLVNVQAGKRSKVGEWTGHALRINRDEQDLNNTLTVAAKSKIFKVTTRVGSPYVTLIADEGDDGGGGGGRSGGGGGSGGGGRIIGDKKYEGYCIDLIAKIEEFLGIKCEFELVPDGNYGSKNPINGQWNGLIKRLLELKADMAICDLTITSERQSAVDFTAPFMNLGISILFSKAEKVVPALFSFMSPLSPEVWMYMATAYLMVSLMLFLQARIAPGEWINPHPCNDEPEELENNFTLVNCLWFTMGSLMQQGCDILPRATSVRLLAGVWYFFILIMVSSYTANLAAFLTAVKMDETIDNVEDLAKQTKIAYGSLKGGATYSFFKNSNTSLYQRLFNTMSDAKPSVFTKTNDEGVERVIKGKRKYAFFMESTTIEYQIERHCELQQVGTLLDNKGYGIAMPPNSPYRTMISTAILHLQEKGELNTLKQKWWKEKGGGMCDEESDEPENSNELGMSNVGGVFLILILGCFISILFAMGEFFWHITDTAIEEKITRSEAFVQELKFVFDFTKTVKIVKKTSKSSSKLSSVKDETEEHQIQALEGDLSLAGSLRRLDSKESMHTVKSTQTTKESIHIAKELLPTTKFRKESGLEKP